MSKIGHTNNELKIGSQVMALNHQDGYDELIRKFEERYPQYVIAAKDVVDGEADAEKYDVLFIRTTREKANHKYKSMRIGEDRFVAIVSANHPLAQEKRINPADLEDDLFILTPEGTWLNRKVRGICNGYGFTPQVAYLGYRGIALFSRISRGEAVTISLEKTAQHYLSDEVCSIPLDVDMPVYVEMIWDPAIQFAAKEKFINFVRRFVEK